MVRRSVSAVKLADFTGVALAGTFAVLRESERVASFVLENTKNGQSDVM